jgi:hypothetical protein
MRERGGWQRAEVPEGIKRYHALALVPGALPHPCEILAKISGELWATFKEAIRLREVSAEAMGTPDFPRLCGESERARRSYLTQLAEAVMSENPYIPKKRGGGPKKTVMV